MFGAWNVRTLQDGGNNPERKTAIIARVLAQKDVDFAALSETRFPDEGSLTETGAGYTYYWIGKPADAARQAGVGFAIKTKLIAQMESIPKGHSERLMSMRLKLQGGRHATIISAYAPTMSYPDDEKEAFYEQLSRVISSAPGSDKILLLGDFNARVGRNHSAWGRVIGPHGVGNENSNGSLLLSFCATNKLTITNTLFQQPNRRKTSWMHPRSKHWHLIDYVIVRQRDQADVHLTRAVQHTRAWSDHRLITAKTALCIAPKVRNQKSCQHPRLNVIGLKNLDTRAELRANIGRELATSDNTSFESCTAEWRALCEATHKAALKTVGRVKRKQQDWFDENDALITPLLSDLHKKHVAYVADKTNSAKKGEYARARSVAQRKCRQMKDDWWSARAQALQDTADRKDMQGFFKELKAVYGPSYNGMSPVRALDGELITEPKLILQRWAEHFGKVWNQPSNIDDDTISDVEARAEMPHLARQPSMEELCNVIRQLKTNKAPGADSIPPEVFKYGGYSLKSRLHRLFKRIWVEEKVPQDFKDATIVHLYKRKGDRADCNNHRGIALLSIAGKILARVIINRLSILAEAVHPESQCGFRPNRGTVDMIFAIRQVQEKCREQHRDLYCVFVDLTKAFDSVSRLGLWKLLQRVGCPEKLVNIIRSFHDGMLAKVVGNGGESDPFEVTNGTKQGCVLAPTLFGIVIAAMITDALDDPQLRGIDVTFRTDGGVFNLARLRAKGKLSRALIKELMFADDCALVAHTEADAQKLMDAFARSARRYGLTVSIKKTEVLFQPKPNSPYVPPRITIDNQPLKVAEHFTYLGSIISSDGSINSEITSRIAKASASFGRLISRLWSTHDVSLPTKISVYRAVVMTTLLYGCETWTLYRSDIRKLDSFHMRCLRRILGVRWQDKVPNTEVLARCHIDGIESYLIRAQLRWAGHLVRMEDERLPKALFYGQIAEGKRSIGAPKKRYKDSLKSNLKHCGIDPSSWESTAKDRPVWRTTTALGVSRFEQSRIKDLQDKRRRRKERKGERAARS